MKTGLDDFRTRLENERKRLLIELDQLKTVLPSSEERREGSPFGKREEEATESLELEKRLALERQTKANLANVENALSKFEKGTYGKCESCGRDIELQRLEALPHARLCLSCMAKQVKEGKGRSPAG